MMSLLTPHSSLWIRFLHTDSRYYNTFIERLGEDSIWKIDMESVSHTNWVAQRAFETHSHVIALEDTLQLGFFDQLQVSMLASSVVAQFPRMHGDIATLLRAVKDEEEIELMKKAQSITDAAFEHICNFIKPGMTEMEIKNELEGFMFANGADSLSFDSIVASGPNGANPHAQPSDRKVQEGEFIVIDFGAGYRDYHSDMTRTVCVGEPTDEMVDVYNVVKTAHEECAKAARAGVVGKDIHDLSVKIISDAGYGTTDMVLDMVLVLRSMSSQTSTLAALLRSQRAQYLLSNLVFTFLVSSEFVLRTSV